MKRWLLLGLLATLPAFAQLNPAAPTSLYGVSVLPTTCTVNQVVAMAGVEYIATATGPCVWTAQVPIDPCTQPVFAIPSGLHCTVVTFSAAQILAATDANPLVVVPALGNTAGCANTCVILPVEGTFLVSPGSHPFYGDNQYLWWQNDSNGFGVLCMNGSNTAAIYLGENSNTGGPATTPLVQFIQFCGPQSVQTDPTLYENQPLVLSAILPEPPPGNTFNRGPVLTVAVGNNPGSGYTTGGTVTIGGDTLVDDCVFTITASGGVVTGVINTNPGTRCPAGTNLSTVNKTGSGSGLSINTTVQPGNGTITVYLTWLAKII